MIHTIEVKGLRALKYVAVQLFPFQVMVGPNASGKSTLFDAVLWVRDILVAGLDAAVFGDRRFNIPQRAANPLDLSWLCQGQPIEIALTLQLPDDIVEQLEGRYLFARYEISISVCFMHSSDHGLNREPQLQFEHEVLWLCNSVRDIPPRKDNSFPYSHKIPHHIIYNKSSPKGWRKVVSKVVMSENDYFRSETSKWSDQFRLGPGKSALANLPEDEQRFPAATWVKRILMEGVHRLVLNAEAMRLPAPAGSPRDFLPDGSNLPWVVYELEKHDPQRKKQWIAHLRTTLVDLQDIQIREKPEDRSRYLELTYTNQLSAPSWLLSDGTLRLLALTLLAYAPTTPSVVLIEEPENGIHPKAMETVMQSLSSVYDTQILCATHSPVVLSLLEARQVLCFGKTSEGAVDIVAGDQHPRLANWQSALHLGDLFATGVLG